MIGWMPTKELGYTNTAIDNMLGISKEYAVEKPKYSLFQAGKVTGKAGIHPAEEEAAEAERLQKSAGSAMAKADGKKKSDKENLKVSADENREKLMLAEIERLRVKLHNAEQENLGLREQNNELRGLSDSVRILSKQHENDRKELHALREHVYKSTEEETDTREVDIAELEKAIAEKKIVIIGGRDKWVNKLKCKFSGWRFISTELSAVVDLNVFDGADFTYFFTEYIAHRTYSAYVKVLRERNLPFGYIHSTNVEMNVRQIYEEVVGE